MSTISKITGHGGLHQYSAGPAFSSNLRFKKHIAPLEILSEATADETDVESTLSGASSSLCTSPTQCTRESSSDESALLLVQRFDSSQYPVAYGNEAKEKRHSILQPSQVQQASHNFATNKSDKSRFKVSFQGETGRSAATEISSTQMHKQVQFSSITEAATSSANQKGMDFVNACKAPGTSSEGCKKQRSEANVQQSESGLNLHPPSKPHYRCFPLLSSRAADLLQKSSNSLCKLQGFIYRLWQRSLQSEDDGDLILDHRLPDTNMDDVNEMKALLNTINHNLKMLETRSRAHPQLLSSKLAPVYFT